MPSSQATRRGSSVPARSRNTKQDILDQAERLFAERGYDRTRLEDVAEAVGIRRASIVYYYPGKAALYEAVLGDVLGDFQGELSTALTSNVDPQAGIEAAIGAWVDFVTRRPTFARLLLRLVADGPRGDSPELLPHIEPFFTLVHRFVADHEATLPQFSSIAPAHLAATITGATVFFVAGISTLVPDLGFDPNSPQHMAEHRAELLKIVRRLLRANED